MKHLLLLALTLLAGLSSWGAFTTPEFYSENFREMGEQSLYPTDGWLTYGNGAVPTEIAANYFDPDGKGPFYALLSYDGVTMAMANTEFADGSEADEWLISPAIEIPYDNTAFFFTACAFANLGQGFGVGANTFKVLVSETGTAKEDFTKTIIDTNVRGSSTTVVTSKRLIAPINDCKGKSIHIAFVVTGSNVGMTGFTNLRLGQYIMNVENLTSEVESSGKDISIDLNVGLKTPVVCDYLDAVLEINGEKVAEKEFKKTFGSPTSYIMQMQRVLFENCISLTDDIPVEYTVTLTPRFEGALASVYKSSISTPGASYPSNVVIEEATATGCGYCTRGIAALEYYLDTYPGGEGKGKVIPIAAHGNMNYADPMNAGVETYVQKLFALNETSVLPSAIFNRASRGLDPTYKAEVEKQIAERSYNSAKILGVNLNQLPDPAENTPAADFSIMADVKFEVRNGYNTNTRHLRAAAVMIENNVVGSSTGYAQTNYFATFDEASVVTLYGNWIIPYIAPFIQGGELGVERIMPSKIAYQHVARGIFPSFDGMQLAEAWQSDVAQEYELSFLVPENVTNLDNTEIVVMIIDEESQKIVASDVISAEHYATGIADVKDDEEPFCVLNNPEGLVVKTTVNGVVEIWSVDGMRLATHSINPGENLIPTASDGILIVKLTSAGTTRTMRIIR